MKQRIPLFEEFIFESKSITADMTEELQKAIENNKFKDFKVKKHKGKEGHIVSYDIFTKNGKKNWSNVSESI